MDIIKIDDFVERPISALRFISLALRRTVSTVRSTRFARLDVFTKSSKRKTIYEFIRMDGFKDLGSRVEQPTGWEV